MFRKTKSIEIYRKELTPREHIATFHEANVNVTYGDKPAIPIITVRKKATKNATKTKTNCLFVSV